jgi:hypothetical protein
MDIVPIFISLLAVLGFVAAVAGVESRDGFDHDGVGLDARPR